MGRLNFDLSRPGVWRTMPNGEKIYIYTGHSISYSIGMAMGRGAVVVGDRNAVDFSSGEKIKRNPDQEFFDYIKGQDAKYREEWNKLQPKRDRIEELYQEGQITDKEADRLLEEVNQEVRELREEQLKQREIDEEKIRGKGKTEEEIVAELQNEIKDVEKRVDEYLSKKEENLELRFKNKEINEHEYNREKEILELDKQLRKDMAKAKEIEFAKMSDENYKPDNFNERELRDRALAYEGYNNRVDLINKELSAGNITKEDAEWHVKQAENNLKKILQSNKEDAIQRTLNEKSRILHKKFDEEVWEVREKAKTNIKEMRIENFNKAREKEGYAPLTNKGKITIEDTFAKVYKPEVANPNVVELNKLVNDYEEYLEIPLSIKAERDSVGINGSYFHPIRHYEGLKPRGAININPVDNKSFDVIKAEHKKHSDSGWHNFAGKGREVGSTMTHEFGHYLQHNMYVRAINKHNKNRTFAQWAGDYKRRFTTFYRKEYGMELSSNDYSRYALVDGMEFFAESFVKIRSGEKKTPFMSAWEEFMYKELKETNF